LCQLGLCLLAILFCLPLLATSGGDDSLTPASPLDRVAEVSGKLVLCGGGKLPDTVRDRFLELAGGAKARLVIIPTAGTGADGPEAAGSLDFWKALHPASAVLLHTRDRHKADEADFVQPLTEATGVWLDGGQQTRLAEAYLGTAVERELRQLLQRGGVIGGTSAGTAVMTQVMIEEGNPHARLGSGFGWLPGAVVDQHFLKRNRVDRLFGVLEGYPGLVGLGIDEQTALVAEGRRLRVLGDSYVTVCLPAGAGRRASVQVLKPGDEADLIALQRAALTRTQPAFPPEKPAPPEVAHGALLIDGGGMPAEAWKRFLELVGGPDACIVVVPTALEDPVPEDPFDAKMLRRAGATNLKILHTRHRAEANKPEFAAVLREAKGVWFTGGRQWRLVESYEDTLTEKLFHEVLQRGGVIGGSSAGASIQADYMVRGHPLGNQVMMAEGYERGFGFLPGVAIDQHFFKRNRQPDMTELVRTYPQLIGIGIDEGAAIVVQGTALEVIGKGNVAIYDRHKPVADGAKDYEEVSVGERYDLKAGKLLEK
jgi:cyanophycinase